MNIDNLDIEKSIKTKRLCFKKADIWFYLGTMMTFIILVVFILALCLLFFAKANILFSLALLLFASFPLPGLILIKRFSTVTTTDSKAFREKIVAFMKQAETPIIHNTDKLIYASKSSGAFI